MLRDELITVMEGLRLHGMRSVLDEVLAAGIKQRRTPERVLLDLLLAEVSERTARSIKYRLGIAKFPVDKDLDSFEFDDSPVNEAQVRSLYQGGFLPTRSNVLLIGGTGTGKTHPAVAIARHLIQQGKRDATSTLSIWSTSWSRRSSPGAEGSLPKAWRGSIWWCWTNSATCRSPEAAGSSSST